MPEETLRFLRIPSAILLTLAATASAQQLPGFENVIEVEEEPVSRYAIEVILFTYGASVSAGTEIFLPVEPPPLEDEPGGDVLGPDGMAGEPLVFGDGAARDDELTSFASGRDLSGPGMDQTLPDDADTAVTDPDEPPSGPEGAENVAVPGYPNDEILEVVAVDGLLPEVDITQPLELVITEAASIEYTPMLDEELSLADAHERLLRLDAYTPVLWAGWTQIVREQAESPSLDLRRLGNLPLSMEGSLMLYLGRFVHLDVDISLEESVVVPAPDAPEYDYDGRMSAGRDSFSEYGYADFADRSSRRTVRSKIVYRIDDDRIMRNGETRYFDHPKFGLIARLTLVEDPEPEDENPALLPDLLPGVPGTPR